MNTYKLIYDYKDNEVYRKSFNDLAMKTFGISFEEWYQQGFWNQNYVCYSYIDSDKVISNISINFMDVYVSSELKKAIQIATVMTDSEYRGKGLAASLMNTIIKKYENTVDFFYLSANESVLEFYPRFKFVPACETRFTMSFLQKTEPSLTMRTLDVQNMADRDLMFHLAGKRVPLSRELSAINDEHILKFYWLNVFQENFYYIEEENTVVIFTVEEDALNLYDVICKENVSLLDILQGIAPSHVKKIVFYFTPDEPLENLTYEHDESNHMFIRPGSIDLPMRFRFPLISQT